MTSPRRSSADADSTSALLIALFKNIKRVIVGKDETLRLALTTFLARGHLLLEDAPGLGKTILARALAQSVDATFKRIQCTPDLLPADVTGVSVYRPAEAKFDFIAGPVFTQVLLADEINRATPRTQSSLLEAMEERQVSVEGRTLELPRPFFVIATQNPVELTGTFPLPEAQLDRFLMRVHMGYPAPQDEISILRAQLQEHPLEGLQPVLTAQDVEFLQQQARAVEIGGAVLKYVVDVTQATRTHPAVRLGVSPRGSLSLMQAARAYAFLSGDSYVSPDTVKKVAPHVLAHRLMLDPRKEHAGVSQISVIRDVLSQTNVPASPAPARIARDEPSITAEA